MIIILPFKAYSVNDYYYANRAHGKKKEAKEWEYSVNWELAKYNFDQLRNDFKVSEHGLKVSITFYYKSYYNKQGKISSKIFDISNCEKPLLDLIFNPVNFGPAPYKSPNAQIDDKNVIEMLVKKLPGLEDQVVIDIEIVPLPKIPQPDRDL